MATSCGHDMTVNMFSPFFYLKWTELFPNDFKSAQESLLFVKRMMVVAVSSITYLRGIFPEDAYRSRYLEGEHSEKLARSLIKSVFGEKNVHLLDAS